MITKSFDAEIKVEDGERAVTATISTIDLDRDGDVMLPSGIQTTDFRKNPIVLWSHKQDVPIGTATGFRTTHRKVQAKVSFAERPDTHHPELEWFPDTILSLFQQKVIRAFSIGFDIDEARQPTDKDVGRFGEKLRRVISKWTLLEFSAVTIPANQNALATAVSKGLIRENSLAYVELTAGRSSSLFTVDPPGKPFVVAPPFRVECATI